MFRRNFIQRITLAGAGSLAASGAAMGAATKRTVTFRVKGFSCITCAVGLDALLSREPGVLHSNSTYP
jgi:Cu+-exporting ATPase